MFPKKITDLLGIQYPIIQAGMIWCSGWELASAVSNAGGLGIIGSGSMYPDVLKEQIKKCKANTNKPFGVNVPLLYPDIDSHIQTIIKEKVPIVITSAGNPKTYTQLLKDNGCKVIHVVSNVKFAIKCQEAGVDAIVAEGFEAGGHNGREETTTLCLVPLVKKYINIPLIAAGGIGSGNALLAMFALGADAVQIGSRFVASVESSAHQNFKNSVVNAKEGDTVLTLKEITPVRLIKNKFYNDLALAYNRSASNEELLSLLGKGRAKKGMFEGNLDEGELEIGQISANIDNILPASRIIENILQEYKDCISEIKNW
jgi:enoyl-[acyl-carrier protein] reductase II